MTESIEETLMNKTLKIVLVVVFLIILGIGFYFILNSIGVI